MYQKHLGVLGVAEPPLKRGNTKLPINNKFAGPLARGVLGPEV